MTLDLERSIDNTPHILNRDLRVSDKNIRGNRFIASQEDYIFQFDFS